MDQGTLAVRASSAALPGSARARPDRFPLRDWPGHGPPGGRGHTPFPTLATSAQSSSVLAAAGVATLSSEEEVPPFFLDARQRVGDLEEPIVQFEA